MERRDLLRASDAERDHVIGELRERFAEGRLTQDTFAFRVDAALRARVRAELTGLLDDLPVPRRAGRGLAAATASMRASASAAVRSLAAAAERWLRRPVPALTLPTGAQQRFTIGREPACDMTLADRTVSRWHASLERVASGWLLADLGSTNGTRLNGWRVNGPSPVRPGDLVSFGGVTLVVTDKAR